MVCSRRTLTYARREVVFFPGEYLPFQVQIFFYFLPPCHHSHHLPCEVGSNKLIPPRGPHLTCLFHVARPGSLFCFKPHKPVVSILTLLTGPHFFSPIWAGGFFLHYILVFSLGAPPDPPMPTLLVSNLLRPVSSFSCPGAPNRKPDSLHSCQKLFLCASPLFFYKTRASPFKVPLIQNHTLGFCVSQFFPMTRPPPPLGSSSRAQPPMQNCTPMFHHGPRAAFLKRTSSPPRLNP